MRRLVHRGTDRCRSCGSSSRTGGTILAVGRSAMNLAQLMQLPVGNHLVERAPDGTTRPLPSEKYYVPGSVLRVAVDTTAPIAHGITEPGRRVLRQQPGVQARSPTRDAEGRPAGGVVRHARRRCAAAGRTARAIWRAGCRSSRRQSARAGCSCSRPEITFRAQPHGTFKFLFNGIYLGAKGGGASQTTARDPGRRRDAAEREGRRGAPASFFPFLSTLARCAGLLAFRRGALAALLRPLDAVLRLAEERFPRCGLAGLTLRLARPFRWRLCGSGAP